MTVGSQNNEVEFNRIYLLLIDPLYDDVQSLLFRSSCVFDNGVVEGNDTILSTFAQCTASRVDDDSYEVYLWSQLANSLIRSKLLRTDPHTGAHEPDSDVEIGEEERILKEKIDDNFDLTKESVLE